MYRRRRSRFNRPQWAWATELSTNFTDTSESSGAPVGAGQVLWPSQRTNWLCETRKVDHVTVRGILLWLQVVYTNTGSTPQPVLPLDLGVIKYATSYPPTSVGERYLPFVEPQLPTQVTAWDGPGLAEGTDPFLWTHHLFPPGYSQNRGSGVFTEGNFTNQGEMAATSNCAYPDTTQDVHMAWQPHVFIKAKRRLQRDEGLGIFMNSAVGYGNGLTYSLYFATRILA